MTAAQAQTTVAAAIGAGYNVQTSEVSGVWKVTVSPAATPLDLQAIAAFAAANTLTGALSAVTLA